MSQFYVSSTSGALPPTVPTSFIEDVGTAVPVNNILNIVGGLGITTTGGGNTVVVSLASPIVSWFVVTSADNPVIMIPNRGYIVKGGAAVNFVLPAAAVIGDIVNIVGMGNLWTVQQNANQKVYLGIVTSTAGALGSVAATSISDSMQLLCVTDNLDFKVLEPIGNILIG